MPLSTLYFSLKLTSQIWWGIIPKFKITDILSVLGIPKATYYRWKKKYKVIELTPLEEIIIKNCEENFYHYGHRKVKPF